MEKKSIHEIVSTVFKAVTLAMGVAVAVLSCMGSLEGQTAVSLLGIGLACAGAALLEHKNDRGASAESILPRMAEEQRTDVDAVTGATNSGKVLRKTVENALAMGLEDTNGR